MNPNIATVQTSEGVADQIYFLPVQPYFVEEVIKKERLDEHSPPRSADRQRSTAALNLNRNGILDKYNVRVLGTPVQAIIDTEDRELFVGEAQREIGVKIFYQERGLREHGAGTQGCCQLGYPVIIRLLYALGGLGSRVSA